MVSGRSSRCSTGSNAVAAVVVILVAEVVVIEQTDVATAVVITAVEDEVIFVKSLIMRLKIEACRKSSV